MSNRLTNLMIVAVVVIAVVAVFRIRSMPQAANGGQAGGSSTAAADTSTIDQGDIQLVVSTTGSIQANQQVALAFVGSNKVTAILVHEGDHVLKGQTIALEDSTSAQDALKQAQAKVAQQQIAVKTLTDKPRQVDVNVAQASLDLANAALKQASSGGDPLQVQIDSLNAEIAKNQLWQTQLSRDASNQARATAVASGRPNAANGFPSDIQNDAGITAQDFNAQIAQANLQAAQTSGASVGSIASAQAQITSAQVALHNLTNPNPNDVAQAEAQLAAAQSALQSAQANLDQTKLVAPFDGIVAQINLNLGEAPSGAAAILLDNSSFFVDVAVQETDISKIAVGQPAMLTFDSLPGKTINGKVIRVAQTATKSGDLETYIVRVQIDPAGASLLSSMTATVNVITSQVSGVTRIRNRFVRLDRPTGKTYVSLRQPDGTFVQQEIVIGLRNDTYSEVKSGLKVGDVVGPVQASQGGFGGPNLGGFANRAAGGGGGG